MADISSEHLKVAGFRSGAELQDGYVRVWNNFAKSDIRVQVADIIGVDSKKPGMSRGYVCVRTAEQPRGPDGIAAALTHPTTVLLALGAWSEARKFVATLNECLTSRPQAERTAVRDPDGDDTASGGPRRSQLQEAWRVAKELSQSPSAPDSKSTTQSPTRELEGGAQAPSSKPPSSSVRRFQLPPLELPTLQPPSEDSE